MKRDELMLLLGEIRNEVTSTKKTQIKILERVDKLEHSGAITGAISGSVMSVGVALLVAQFKEFTGN